MGKRSNFERRERDFYATPKEAVLPLLPHLPTGPFTFSEPCAGDGRLITWIETLSAGRCTHAMDIEPQSSSILVGDATCDPVAGVDLVITNPPWDRKLLHPMIANLSALPCWLLFDADWLYTKQSRDYLPLLHKVVAIGRVKWIEGSKMTGKDNCAWYFFDVAPRVGEIAFIGRR